jgi:nucleoside-diphosphate-sugar epimerase
MINNIIFVAGASGAIGRRLCRLLIGDGWHVVGTTRSPERAAELRSMGVEAVVVDVFDEVALASAVRNVRPSVVIHQLTDLPPGLDPSKMAEALPRNARLREIGTRNLVAAAVAARSVRRMIAQSISFIYAPGPMPYREEMPLNLQPGPQGLTARGVASLETQVLSAPFNGLVLRYGRLYGPGTGFDEPPGKGSVHVDAAADAARRATTRGKAGIYNIAEDDGTVTIEKATQQLGWRPDFRINIF